MLADEPSGWGRVTEFQCADRPVVDYLASPLPNLLHTILRLLTLAFASIQLRIVCEETRSEATGRERGCGCHISGTQEWWLMLLQKRFLRLSQTTCMGHTQHRSGRGAVPTQRQSHPFRLCPPLVSLSTRGHLGDQIGGQTHPLCFLALLGA